MRIVLILLSVLILSIFRANANADTSMLITPTICAVSNDTLYGYTSTLYWQNTDTNTKYFIIYSKFYDTGSTFQPIATVQARNLNQYIDDSLQGQSGSYSYKIQGVGDSGELSSLSVEAKQLILGVTEIVDDSVVQLNWYNVDPYSNDTVIIYRSLLGEDFKMIDVVPLKDSSYFDTIPYAIWVTTYRLEIIKYIPCFEAKDSATQARLFCNMADVHFGSISNSPKSQLKVFPNPVQNTLNLNTTEFPLNAVVCIFNLNGQKQFSGIILNKEIDVSFLPDGVYQIMIMTDDMVLQGKFVKRP